MVKKSRNNIFLTVILFLIVLILSILSKWFDFFDLGIFNYSILFILVLVLPNLNKIFNQIKNSEIQVIKLPFCELVLLKKYDYYFIGNRKDDDLGDLVVLGFYKDVLNEKEAKDKFKEEFPNQGNLENIEIIKQVHYKINE